MGNTLPKTLQLHVCGLSASERVKDGRQPVAEGGVPPCSARQCDRETSSCIVEAAHIDQGCTEQFKAAAPGQHCGTLSQWLRPLVQSLQLGWQPDESRSTP